ncbi:MAG: hypothetical protein AAF587_41330 [Bacteroidota bacterium]
MRHLLANIVLHILVAFLFASVGCVERTPLPDSSASEGVITKQDARRCMCCGGWFIEIEGQTETYRMLTVPKNSNLTLETFPIPVILEWEKDPEACLGDEILVHSIREK